MAKTGRELSAPVLNMLVVNLLFSFLTHFRFTDNQHDQGRGRASFAKKKIGTFWKLVGKPIHCHLIVNSLFAEVRALQKEHESVDKSDLRKKFKPDCKKSISLKYLFGLIFGAMLDWMGRKKEEVGRVLRGNG